MTLAEAKSGVKAVYLQAASLAGLQVAPTSPERLAELVGKGFRKVTADRQAEAVANVLRVIAAALDHAQKIQTKVLHESDVDKGKQSVCPVYPFGSPPSARSRRPSRARA